MLNSIKDGSPVLLSDGQWFSFTSSKVFMQTKAFVLVLGNQVPMSQRSFMEFYIGMGIKLIDVRNELGRRATPLSSTFPVLIGPSSMDSFEGLHEKPYFNAGVKFGFEALQQ